MKNSQLHVLVSVDRDFDVIPDLKRIDGKDLPDQLGRGANRACGVG